MAWLARLRLDLRMEDGRCAARHSHEGPLRILQTLYPEGGRIAHNVLVHPPGGLVGGDTLETTIEVGEGAHGLVTTPGASRFYRSEGEPATQQTRVRVAAGGRFEWLPLEAICYAGCIARNELEFELAPDAQLLGWDVVALGLPGAGQPFSSGSLQQHIEVQGAWLDRGRVEAGDAILMDGPLGLAGHRCMATLFFAAGGALPRETRDAALDAARAVVAAHKLGAWAGATSPGPQVIVVRALAPLVEPALELLKQVRAAWRPLLWELAPVQPRGWAL